MRRRASILLYNRPMLLALLQSMRPKQWIKNGIIFAPLIFDRQLLLPTPLLQKVGIRFETKFGTA